MNCREFESLIDMYLDGTIPEEKKEMFEEHYFLCDGCYASLALVESLRNQNVKIVPRRAKSYSFILKPSMILASVIFVVFASFFLTDLNKNRKKLIEISDFSPPLYIKGENRGNNISHFFNNAMGYYQEGNYEQAYRIISSPGKGNPQTWYFRGILALLNGNNTDALEHFNLITTEMSPSYYDEAIYYRGICYLRMNRKKDAKKEFTILESMFSPLSRKASEKLKMISEL